jgi:hypothetical protein
MAISSLVHKLAIAVHMVFMVLCVCVMTTDRAIEERTSSLSCVALESSIFVFLIVQKFFREYERLGSNRARMDFVMTLAVYNLMLKIMVTTLSSYISIAFIPLHIIDLCVLFLSFLKDFDVFYPLVK